VCVVLIFAANAFSQEPAAQRPRVVQSNLTETLAVNQPAQANNQTQRIPTLTNQITVQNQPSLVQKTGSSQPLNLVSPTSVVRSYNPVFNQRLLMAIQQRIGIPYRYGSNGPTSYDCSGLVWSVFQDAGYNYERSSARTLWQSSVTVEGDDKYQFGTLVFFNGLGHIGIVVNDKGFYHASSSKGVTYSSFEGYWGKRIVGFRRLNLAN